MAAAALPPAMIIDIPRDNAPPQNNVGSQADESTVARENSAPPSMEQAESSLSVSSIMSSTSKLTTSGFIERVQARVRPDEVYREEIVRSIFGEVGTPVEDFSCAVMSRILLHGRMYVTTTFVCFYSNLFGYEKIIKIPFCHMRCITKEKTALFIPNAIAIITSKKEYIFRSFWDREDAFRTLKTCHQESLTQSASNGEGSLSQEAPPRVGISGRSLFSRGNSMEKRKTQNRLTPRRRSNSGGSEKDVDDKVGKVGADKRLRPLGGESISRGNSSSDLGAANAKALATTSTAAERLDICLDLVKLEAIPSDEAIIERKAGREVYKEGVGGALVPVADREEVECQNRNVSEDYYESEVDVLGVEGTPVTSVSLGATSGGGHPPNKCEEFKLALAALGEGHLINNGGSERRLPPRSNVATARISADIPCQLKIFFELFIANDAEKGLPALHESLGDSEVQATPWKVAGGALGMTREIRFVHPVKAPIGPDRTRAVKLQRCRLYGEHGLIMETSTHLEDIVMSDYFQIEDRCVVQPGEKDAIRVDVEVEIKFVKSTMFRKAIETKSLNETRVVWESFIAMARKAIQSRQPPALPLRLPTSGEDSDDEDRIHAARDRLRERRKHRQRNRNHPSQDRVPSVEKDKPHNRPRARSIDKGRSHSRPRAASAASLVAPSHLAVVEKLPPYSRGVGGVGGERKASRVVNSTSSGVTAQVAPVSSQTSWFLSFSALPWMLLTAVFLWEALLFLRFSSEAKGFLEAAETALAVLGASVEEEAEEGGRGAVVPRALLREELARGLVSIYSRNRFLWPFNKV